MSLDGTMYDVRLVYSTDSDQWAAYFQGYLKNESCDLRILLQKDTDLLNFRSSSISTRSSSNTDSAISSTSEVESKVLIVIISPLHLLLLLENHDFRYDGFAVDHGMARLFLFLCGAESADFDQLDRNGLPLSQRFPNFQEWKQVTHNDHEQLMMNVTGFLNTSSKRPRQGNGSKKRRKMKFIMKPSQIKSHDSTLVTILFEKELPDPSSEGAGRKVEVTFDEGRGGQRKSFRLTADRCNPFTYQFTAPPHPIGPVRAKVILDNFELGSIWLTYTSSLSLPSSSMVDAISYLVEVHVQQISELVGYLEELKIPVEEIDRRLAKIISDNHPATEPLFVSIRSIRHDSTRFKYPTLLHVAARYGLEQLCHRLSELPDVKLAIQMANANDRTPEEMARDNYHYDIAALLQDMNNDNSDEDDYVPLRPNASAMTIEGTDETDNTEDDSDYDADKYMDMYDVFKTLKKSDTNTEEEFWLDEEQQVGIEGQMPTEQRNESKGNDSDAEGDPRPCLPSTDALATIERETKQTASEGSSGAMTSEGNNESDSGDDDDYVPMPNSLQRTFPPLEEVQQTLQPEPEPTAVTRSPSTPPSLPLSPRISEATVSSPSEVEEPAPRTPPPSPESQTKLTSESSSSNVTQPSVVAGSDVSGLKESAIASLPDNQKELIDILQQVITGQMTLPEGEFLTEEWKLQYKKADMKKQAELAKLREEMSRSAKQKQSLVRTLWSKFGRRPSDLAEARASPVCRVSTLGRSSSFNQTTKTIMTSPKLTNAPTTFISSHVGVNAKTKKHSKKPFNKATRVDVKTIISEVSQFPPELHSLLEPAADRYSSVSEAGSRESHLSVNSLTSTSSGVDIDIHQTPDILEEFDPQAAPVSEENAKKFKKSVRTISRFYRHYRHDDTKIIPKKLPTGTENEKEDRRRRSSSLGSSSLGNIGKTPAASGTDKKSFWRNFISSRKQSVPELPAEVPSSTKTQPKTTRRNRSQSPRLLVGKASLALKAPNDEIDIQGFHKSTNTKSIVTALTKGHTMMDAEKEDNWNNTASHAQIYEIKGPKTPDPFPQNVLHEMPTKGNCEKSENSTVPIHESGKEDLNKAKYEGRDVEKSAVTAEVIQGRVLDNSETSSGSYKNNRAVESQHCLQTPSPTDEIPPLTPRLIPKTSTNRRPPPIPQDATEVQSTSEQFRIHRNSDLIQKFDFEMKLSECFSVTFGQPEEVQISMNEELQFSEATYQQKEETLFCHEKSFSRLAEDSKPTGNANELLTKKNTEKDKIVHPPFPTLLHETKVPNSIHIAKAKEASVMDGSAEYFSFQSGTEQKQELPSMPIMPLDVLVTEVGASDNEPQFKEENNDVNLEVEGYTFKERKIIFKEGEDLFEKENTTRTVKHEDRAESIEIRNFSKGNGDIKTENEMFLNVSAGTCITVNRNADCQMDAVSTFEIKTDNKSLIALRNDITSNCEGGNCTHTNGKESSSNIPKAGLREGQQQRQAETKEETRNEKEMTLQYEYDREGEDRTETGNCPLDRKVNKGEEKNSCCCTWIENDIPDNDKPICQTSPGENLNDDKTIYNSAGKESLDKSTRFSVAEQPHLLISAGIMKNESSTIEIKLPDHVTSTEKRERSLDTNKPETALHQTFVAETENRLSEGLKLINSMGDGKEISHYETRLTGIQTEQNIKGCKFQKSAENDLQTRRGIADEKFGTQGTVEYGPNTPQSKSFTISVEEIEKSAAIAVLEAQKEDPLQCLVSTSLPLSCVDDSSTLSPSKTHKKHRNPSKPLQALGISAFSTLPASKQLQTQDEVKPSDFVSQRYQSTQKDVNETLRKPRRRSLSLDLTIMNLKTMEEKNQCQHILLNLPEKARGLKDHMHRNSVSSVEHHSYDIFKSYFPESKSENHSRDVSTLHCKSSDKCQKYCDLEDAEVHSEDSGKDLPSKMASFQLLRSRQPATLQTEDQKSAFDRSNSSGFDQDDHSKIPMCSYPCILSLPLKLRQHLERQIPSDTLTSKRHTISFQPSACHNLPFLGSDADLSGMATSLKRPEQDNESLLPSYVELPSCKRLKYPPAIRPKRHSRSLSDPSKILGHVSSEYRQTKATDCAGDKRCSAADTQGVETVSALDDTRKKQPEIIHIFNKEPDDVLKNSTERKHIELQNVTVKQEMETEALKGRHTSGHAVDYNKAFDKVAVDEEVIKGKRSQKPYSRSHPTLFISEENSTKPCKQAFKAQRPHSTCSPISEECQGLFRHERMVPKVEDLSSASALSSSSTSAASSASVSLRQRLGPSVLPKRRLSVSIDKSSQLVPVVRRSRSCDIKKCVTSGHQEDS